MFPRSLEQSGEPQLPLPSGDEDDSLNGFRRLDDAQLDALAEEITRQVRLRGPFVSLAHFVNRALVDLTSDTDKLGRSGALQSAIDDSGLNMAPGSSSSGFANLTPTDNLVRMQRRGTANQQPLADMVGTRAGATFVTYPSAPADPVPAFPGQSKDLNPGNTGSMLSDREMLTNDEYRPEQGFRSTGIPGWLTQADVLQVIGPVLSARSDTFRIRSYGEALDSSGTPVARAWCEAIVQRTPEFIDPANPSETRPANLNLTNARFGRRFAVVSFRWLHPDEI
jgi:Arc/MetJ-type ribon-helix-helix transcriptional regulator